MKLQNISSGRRLTSADLLTQKTSKQVRTMLVGDSHVEVIREECGVKLCFDPHRQMYVIVAKLNNRTAEVKSLAWAERQFKRFVKINGGI